METSETHRVSSGSSGNDGALRRRIVEHARRQFLDQGFSTVRTEDLAKELGISKKTLYRLFSSKNELVLEAARALMGDIDEELGSLFASDMPFPDKFRRILASVARHVGTIGRHFMVDIARYAPEVWEEIDRFRRERVLSRLKGVIDQGISEGYVHASVNSELFVATVYSIAQNVLTPERLSSLGVGPRDVVDFALRLFTVGILTTEGRNYLEKGEIDDA
ncbi:MAG: TetR/AcrR family transcriptional regulator [Spirochaetaceae bacterium]